MAHGGDAAIAQQGRQEHQAAGVGADGFDHFGQLFVGGGGGANVLQAADVADQIDGVGRGQAADLDDAGALAPLEAGIGDRLAGGHDEAAVAGVGQLGGNIEHILQQLGLVGPLLGGRGVGRRGQEALEVVEHHERGLAPQGGDEGAAGGGEIGGGVAAEREALGEGLAQSGQDRGEIGHAFEAHEQSAPREPARPIEPAGRLGGQGGFALAAHAHDDGDAPGLEGALQGQPFAQAPDEVMLQNRQARHALLVSGGGVGIAVQGHAAFDEHGIIAALEQHRHEPVLHLQGVASAGPAAMGIAIQSGPGFVDRSAHGQTGAQLLIESGREPPGRLDQHAVGHGDHTVGAGLQQRRGHGAARLFPFVGALTRLQERQGQPHPAQQLGELLSRDELGLALGPAVGIAMLEAKTAQPGLVVIDAMAVEVQHVILAAGIAQPLDEGLDRGRPQKVDLHLGAQRRQRVQQPQRRGPRIDQPRLLGSRHDHQHPNGRLHRAVLSPPPCHHPPHGHRRTGHEQPSVSVINQLPRQRQQSRRPALGGLLFGIGPGQPQGQSPPLRIVGIQPILDRLRTHRLGQRPPQRASGPRQAGLDLLRPGRAFIGRPCVVTLQIPPPVLGLEKPQRRPKLSTMAVDSGLSLDPDDLDPIRLPLHQPRRFELHLQLPTPPQRIDAEPAERANHRLLHRLQLDRHPVPQPLEPLGQRLGLDAIQHRHHPISLAVDPAPPHPLHLEPQGHLPPHPVPLDRLRRQQHDHAPRVTDRALDGRRQLCRRLDSVRVDPDLIDAPPQTGNQLGDAMVIDRGMRDKHVRYAHYDLPAWRHGTVSHMPRPGKHASYHAGWRVLWSALVIVSATIQYRAINKAWLLPPVPSGQQLGDHRRLAETMTGAFWGFGH